MNRSTWHPCHLTIFFFLIYHPNTAIYSQKSLAMKWPTWQPCLFITSFFLTILILPSSPVILSLAAAAEPRRRRWRRRRRSTRTRTSSSNSNASNSSSSSTYLLPLGAAAASTRNRTTDIVTTHRGSGKKELRFLWCGAVGSFFSGTPCSGCWIGGGINYNQALFGCDAVAFIITTPFLPSSTPVSFSSLSIIYDA